MKDRRHLSDIWQMLQGDIYETVPLSNLIKIIFALLGCHDCAMIEASLKHYLPEEGGCNLMVTESESKAIKSNFEALALNRLKKGEFSHEPREENFSFKPFVSKSSSDMAEKYRKRMLQESEKLINDNLIHYDVGEDGVVDHIDLLLLDEKRKELRLQMQRQ